MYRITSFLIALIVALSPLAANAKKKTCKPSVQAKHTTNVRGAEKSAWREAVERRYGKGWGDWKLAINKKTKCKRQNLRVKQPGGELPPKFICYLAAQPCVYKTRNKYCVGNFSSELFAYGKGTGKTKKQAKEQARRSWGGKVNETLGNDFSDWKTAMKRSYYCGKLLSQEKVCVASARPCKFR